MRGPDDGSKLGVTAGPRLEARTQIGEQLFDHRLIPQTGIGETALRQRISLGKRDQRLDDPAQFLGLGNRRPDRLVTQERRCHVAEHRMAMR